MLGTKTRRATGPDLQARFDRLRRELIVCSWIVLTAVFGGIICDVFLLHGLLAKLWEIETRMLALHAARHDAAGIAIDNWTIILTGGLLLVFLVHFFVAASTLSLYSWNQPASPTGFFGRFSRHTLLKCAVWTMNMLSGLGLLSVAWFHFESNAFLHEQFRLRLSAGDRFTANAANYVIAQTACLFGVLLFTLGFGCWVRFVLHTEAKLRAITAQPGPTGMTNAAPD